MMETLLRIFLFFADSYRRRLHLAKAVYYHAKRSQELIDNHRDIFKEIRKKIMEDAAYTPFVVKSLIADELTYGQTIKAMECLGGNEDDETVIISYFHKHVLFHSLVLTFNSEIASSWTQERKLKLLDMIEESADDMRGYAGRTTEVLKKVLERRLKGLQTWSTAGRS